MTKWARDNWPVFALAGLLISGATAYFVSRAEAEARFVLKEDFKDTQQDIRFIRDYVIRQGDRK